MARLLKRELNKQERASDTGMKSAAMGVIPFTINPDLKDQLEAFGKGEGDHNWIEMVRLEKTKRQKKNQTRTCKATTRRHTTLERPHGVLGKGSTWKLCVLCVFFCSNFMG